VNRAAAMGLRRYYIYFAYSFVSKRWKVIELTNWAASGIIINIFCCWMKIRVLVQNTFIALLLIFGPSDNPLQESHDCVSHMIYLMIISYFLVSFSMWQTSEL
jgi:hypothetical protein